MNNVALGQYMPLDSVVHKMDPRSKIMIMLFLMDMRLLARLFYLVYICLS